MICYGKGHTESDLILYLPEDKIVFTGDLVFIGIHPYLADGYIEDWKSYLTTMERLEIEKLVPGHGNIGDAKDLRIMKTYIEMIEEEVQWMIANDMPITEAASIGIPEPFSAWWFEDFFTRNVQFIYKTERFSNE